MSKTSLIILFKFYIFLNKTFLKEKLICKKEEKEEREITKVNSITEYFY